MLTAAFQNDKGKVYFFGSDGQYVRYDVGRHSADPEYPKSIKTNWRALPFEGVDAAFQDMRLNVRNRDIFFFYGNQYTRYRSDHTIPNDFHVEYPLPLTAWGLDQVGWHRVDAALQNQRGTVYFFNGNQYVRCSEFEHARVDREYPRTIRDGWGLDWPRVDAAFQNPAGHRYLFYGEDYVLFSEPGRRMPDDGYPRTILSGWGSDVASL
jgi:hypothetical protein